MADTYRTYDDINIMYDQSDTEYDGGPLYVISPVTGEKLYLFTNKNKTYLLTEKDLTTIFPDSHTANVFSRKNTPVLFSTGEKTRLRSEATRQYLFTVTDVTRLNTNARRKQYLFSDVDKTRLLTEKDKSHLFTKGAKLTVYRDSKQQ